MKLTGELKDKVDKAKDLEEAKEVIAGAGMLLNDDEVSKVAGGIGGRYCIGCPKKFFSKEEMEQYCVICQGAYVPRRTDDPAHAPAHPPKPVPAMPSGLDSRLG